METIRPIQSSPITAISYEKPLWRSRVNEIAVETGSPPPYDGRRQPGIQRHHVFRSWRWEFLAMGVAFALLAAMFGLLARFNGQRVPDWGFSINLSTLLALISTSFRAAITVVVAGIICQCKWSWYSTKDAKPLRQLQNFDDATHCAIGAAFLIPIVMRRNLTAFIASVLVILSFSVGSFVQQAIKTAQCAYPVSDGAASLPYAHFVPRSGGYFSDAAGKDEPDMDAKVAIYTSLMNPRGSQNDLSGSCTTGNCTFPRHDIAVGKDIKKGNLDPSNDEADAEGHATVGICNACVDITSLIQRAGTIVFTLPNGMSISTGPSDTPLQIASHTNLTWVGTLITPELTRVSRWAFANVTVLTATKAGCASTSDGRESCEVAGLGSTEQMVNYGAIATTCALYPCVRKYIASIMNGNLTENELQSAPLVPHLDNLEEFDNAANQNGWSNRYMPYTAVMTPCRVGDALFTASNISSAPNGTQLHLYGSSATDGVVGQALNISAPEACIYRHQAWFGLTLSRFFTDKVFSGSCTGDPKAPLNVWCTTGTDGIQRWVEQLYASANATSSTISNYFDAFAGALTNQYRMRFGSEVYDPQFDPQARTALPPGAVDGVAWRTTVCTAVEWQWLLVPAGVTVTTAALLASMIWSNWVTRSRRPVWKESVLATMFYRERFETSNGTRLGAGDVSDILGEKERLLDASQMDRIGDNVLVKFDWDGGRASCGIGTKMPGEQFNGPKVRNDGFI